MAEKIKVLLMVTLCQSGAAGEDGPGDEHDRLMHLVRGTFELRPGSSGGNHLEASSESITGAEEIGALITGEGGTISEAALDCLRRILLSAAYVPFYKKDG